MTDNPYRAPQAPLGAEPTQRDVDYAFAPPRGAVVYALGADVLAALASIVVVLGQIDLIAQATAEGAAVDPVALEANGIQMSLVASVELIASLACIVLWGSWTIRAAKNIRSLEPDMKFEFTPGWTFGWFFVPFFNLIRPYQAAREIFVFSAPESRDGQRVDTSVVSLWWGAWILSNLIAQVVFRFTPDSGAGSTELLSSGWTTIAADAATIVSALAAIRMIQLINGNQRRKHQPVQQGSTGDTLPPWARQR